MRSTRASRPSTRAVPLARLVEPKQRIDERRFPRAVWPQQADGVTVQVSGQSIENGAAAKPHLQPIKFDYAHVILLRSDHCICSGATVLVSVRMQQAAESQEIKPEQVAVAGHFDPRVLAPRTDCRGMRVRSQLFSASADSPLICDSSGVNTGPRF